ncbi:hypothetical protein SMACR_02130 [Sordaria macrospora]|uniref:Uncharacterized protein n=1 Tax=Sordaria macrospora TaxID=5147 RepID=A0A8S8ZTA5_SORMA|nr:hypothetical protein SMACR_02130 [Sordaria macrospora]WPJ63782.1 hypothetical protein SMAC4_02130 [Sordaria macrospora]
MANNQTQAPKDASLQEEERLEDALDYLNELHVQLQRLRSAIPRMFHPMSVKPSSPQNTFAAFSNAVQDTGKEIHQFKDTIRSAETEKVFNMANESRRTNPMGIKPWRARDDPEWTTRKRRRLNNGLKQS